MMLVGYYGILHVPDVQYVHTELFGNGNLVVGMLVVP